MTSTHLQYQKLRQSCFKIVMSSPPDFASVTGPPSQAQGPESKHSAHKSATAGALPCGFFNFPFLPCKIIHLHIVLVRDRKTTLEARTPRTQRVSASSLAQTSVATKGCWSQAMCLGVSSSESAHLLELAQHLRSVLRQGLPAWEMGCRLPTRVAMALNEKPSLTTCNEKHH